MTAPATFETEYGPDMKVASKPVHGSEATTEALDARANSHSKDNGSPESTVPAPHLTTGNVERTMAKSRINPDDPKFVWTITAGVAFAGIVAFSISFVALMEVAGWLGLPTWMRWAVPAFIDSAILVYAGSVLIHKARGEKTGMSWLMLALFTSVSVVGNGAHAWSYANTLDQPWQAWIGTFIAGFTPIAVFFATEELSRVAVEDPESRRREIEQQAEWEAQQAEAEQRRIAQAAEREHAMHMAQIEHEREAREAQMDQEVHLARVEEQRAESAAQVEKIRAQAQLETASAQAEQARAEAERARAETERLTAERAAAQPAPEPAPAAPLFPVPDREEPARASMPAPTFPTTQPATASAPAKSVGMDAIAEFVVARTAAGEKVSGADLASEFGFSEKTGRRRLQQLREQHPEAFEGGEA